MRMLCQEKIIFSARSDGIQPELRNIIEIKGDIDPGDWPGIHPCPLPPTLYQTQNPISGIATGTG
jgi:hypothetical protein